MVIPTVSFEINMIQSEFPANDLILDNRISMKQNYLLWNLAWWKGVKVILLISTFMSFVMFIISINK